MAAGPQKMQDDICAIMRTFAPFMEITLMYNQDTSSLPEGTGEDMLSFCCTKKPKAVITLQTASGVSQPISDPVHPEILRTGKLRIGVSFVEWYSFQKIKGFGEQWATLQFDVASFDAFLSKINLREKRARELVVFLFRSGSITLRQNNTQIDPAQKKKLEWLPDLKAGKTAVTNGGRPFSSITIQFKNYAQARSFWLTRQLEGVVTDKRVQAMIQTLKMSLEGDLTGAVAVSAKKVDGTTRATVKAAGVEIKIPVNVVKQAQEFAIAAAPPAIVQTQTQMFTNNKAGGGGGGPADGDAAEAPSVVALTPHNVEFERPVKLSFDVTSDKAVLYVQEADETSQVLNAWTQVPGKVKEGKLTVLVGKFCYMFVSHENAPTQLGGLSPVDPKDPDLVRPGVNVRGVCERCETNVTVPRGFVKDLNFFATFAKDGSVPRAVCPKCSQVFVITQLVMCDTDFCIDYEPTGSPAGKLPGCLSQGTLMFFGHSQAEGSMSFKKYVINAKPSPWAQGVANSQSGEDAAVSGGFVGRKVVILNTCDQMRSQDVLKFAGAALKDKGFEVEVVEEEPEFAKKLPTCDVGWIIPDRKWTKPSSKAELIQACKTHLAAGKGLYLWGENEPFFLQTGDILQALFGFRLVGNTPGNHALKGTHTRERGTFFLDHVITTGVPALHEGVTICHPDNLPAEFQVLAHSTDGNPCIFYRESRNGQGRIVVDCGFTKLMEGYWTATAGTARYITNASCWLVGTPSSNQTYLIPKEEDEEEYAWEDENEEEEN